MWREKKAYSNRKLFIVLSWKKSIEEMKFSEDIDSQCGYQKLNVQSSFLINLFCYIQFWI